MKVQSVASSIIEELQSTTDLSLFDRKTVAYYALASHALPKFDAFPVLVILGETCTGKNNILWTIRRGGYHTADPLELRNSSWAVLRDYLIETAGHVAIVDEADSLREDMPNFEESFKVRSRRFEANISVNRPKPNGRGYQKQKTNVYGPLVLHRQMPLQSGSLLTRSIVLSTSSNLDRTYSKPTTKFRHSELDIPLDVIELEGAPRIADNWTPLVSVAAFLGDSTWTIELTNTLVEKSDALIREAQASEPTRLVLDGALALSFNGTGEWNRNRRWPLKELTQWLWENHACRMTPRQVGNILRQHELKTVKSNGIYVADIQPRELLSALDRAHNVDDEQYEKLVETVRMSTKSTKSTLSTHPYGASLWPEDY